MKRLKNETEGRGRRESERDRGGERERGPL